MFIVNVIGFDLVWFGLVYWGNSFIPIALILLGLHFCFISKFKTKELQLVCIVALIGIAVDSTLQVFDVFIFESDTTLPFWLITLWACFAATLCHSLNFLQKSKILQWLIGALLAPLSYIAGNKLQAVSFSLTTESTFIILSLIWGLLMIIFFSLKHHLIDRENAYA